MTSGAYNLTLNVSLSLSPSTQPLNSSGNTVLGGTYVDGTTAYYSFTATTTGDLSASVTPVDETAFLPRLTLYGASGQLLIQSDAVSASNAPAQLDQQLQPGTYYLGISAVTDSPAGNQSYVLDTTFGQALPPFQALTVGSEPSSVAVGNFTHDGNLDIVTANPGEQYGGSAARSRRRHLPARRLLCRGQLPRFSSGGRFHPRRQPRHRHCQRRLFPRRNCVGVAGSRRRHVPTRRLVCRGRRTRFRGGWGFQQRRQPRHRHRKWRLWQRV